jgi:hypothetical protein
MSTSILELNGTHLGKRVTIVDDKGTNTTVIGTLFEVRHEADKISNHSFGVALEPSVGRRTCRVNIGGRSELALSEWATFTVDG